MKEINLQEIAFTHASQCPAGEARIEPCQHAASPCQPDNTLQRIQLHEGYSVSPEFFHEIRLHVGGRLPGLQPGCPYKAEELAGKEFWALLCPGDQRLAGRCIAHMVTHQMLPLTFFKGKHEYPKLYRLI